jgi:hypothetical protein
VGGERQAVGRRAARRVTGRRWSKGRRATLGLNLSASFLEKRREIGRAAGGQGGLLCLLWHGGREALVRLLPLRDWAQALGSCCAGRPGAARPFRRALGSRGGLSPGPCPARHRGPAREAHRLAGPTAWLGPRGDGDAGADEGHCHGSVPDPSPTTTRPKRGSMEDRGGLRAGSERAPPGAPRACLPAWFLDLVSPGLGSARLAVCPCAGAWAPRDGLERAHAAWRAAGPAGQRRSSDWSSHARPVSHDQSPVRLEASVSVTVRSSALTQSLTRSAVCQCHAYITTMHARLNRPACQH